MANSLLENVIGENHASTSEDQPVRNPHVCHSIVIITPSHLVCSTNNHLSYGPDERYRGEKLSETSIQGAE